MGRVAKRAEIGIVGSLNSHRSAGPQEAVELFHGPNHIRSVLDDVNGQNMVEGVIPKRQAAIVQIANDVGRA